MFTLNQMAKISTIWNTGELIKKIADNVGVRLNSEIQ